MSPKWFKAIINEFAPDSFQKVLEQRLGTKTTEGIYSFIIQHRDDDWYDLLLQEKEKRAIRKLAPTDLSWLNITWVIAVLGKANPKAASLILGSPDLKHILVERVEGIKRRMHNAVTS